MVAEPILAGEVSRVAFDYGVELLFAAGDVVRIEGGGELHAGASERRDFDPAEPTASAPTLLGLLRADVEVSREDSMLIVASSDGRVVLRVPPADDHEAWTVSTADGTILVCGVDRTVTVVPPP